MDSVAQLGAEHPVNEAMLGDSIESRERRRGDDGVEMVPIACNVGLGAGDAGLDPLLQLIRGCGHPSSVARSHRYTS